MQIDYLADHPDLVPLLAEWQHRTFGHFAPQTTLEQRVAKISQTRRRSAIPMTVVALSEERPVGTACLVAEDMSTHPELSPWLASVYVEPDSRRQGLGSRLVARIETEAKKLGVERLYLYTADMQPFYEPLGWSVKAVEDYRGYEVALMEKALG